MPPAAWDVRYPARAGGDGRRIRVRATARWLQTLHGMSATACQVRYVWSPHAVGSRMRRSTDMLAHATPAGNAMPSTQCRDSSPKLAAAFVLGRPAFACKLVMHGSCVLFGVAVVLATKKHVWVKPVLMTAIVTVFFVSLTALVMHACLLAVLVWLMQRVVREGWYGDAMLWSGFTSAMPDGVRVGEAAQTGKSELGLAPPLMVVVAAVASHGEGGALLRGQGEVGRGCVGVGSGPAGWWVGGASSAVYCGERMHVVGNAETRWRQRGMWFWQPGTRVRAENSPPLLLSYMCRRERGFDGG